jgi:hypothetical protein
LGGVPVIQSVVLGLVAVAALKLWSDWYRSRQLDEAIRKLLDDNET